jgi:hypothetical protein
MLYMPGDKARRSEPSAYSGKHAETCSDPAERSIAPGGQNVIFINIFFEKKAGSEWVLVPAQEQIHGSQFFTVRRFRTQAF